GPGHPEPGAVAILGLDGHGSPKQIAAGDRYGDAYCGHGPAGGASGRPALGTGLRPAIFDGWTLGQRHGVRGPLWPMDSPDPAPRQRPDAETALGPPS